MPKINSILVFLVIGGVVYKDLWSNGKALHNKWKMKN